MKWLTGLVLGLIGLSSIIIYKSDENHKKTYKEDAEGYTEFLSKEGPPFPETLKRKQAPKKEPQLHKNSWENLGPLNYGGKVFDLAVHPNNKEIVYAAFTDSGIWKRRSKNNWTQLTDISKHNFTASVTLWSGNPEHVYVGLGRPGRRLEEGGILKSTDGGASWKNIGPDIENGIYRIHVGENSNHVLAITCNKIYRTLNGGQEWTVVHEVTADDWWADLPDMAAGGGAIFVCSKKIGVIKSVDQGQTWQPAETGIAHRHEMVMAMAPSDPNRLYLEVIKDGSIEIDFYKSVNAGASWELVSRINDIYHQGRFDMAITVDPRNADRMLVGNVPLYVSEDAGKTFSRRPQGAHADHLKMAFAPSNPQTVYNGNDGGVFRSTNGGLDWERDDIGNNTTIAFSFDMHPEVDRIYLSAADYFPGVTYVGSKLKWEEFHGYEWQYYLAEPNNPQVVYSGIGDVWRTLDGGETWKNVEPGPGEPHPYKRPIHYDPASPHIVYTATQRLYKSVNRGESWTTLYSFEHRIDDFAISPLDSNEMVVLTDSRIYTSANGGQTFEEWGQQQYYLGTVAFHPTQPGVFYVGSAWELVRYEIAGKKRKRISEGLPEYRIQMVIKDPDFTERIIALMDLGGVYISEDDGASWEPMGQGLPNVTYWHGKLVEDTLYVSGAQGMWRYKFSKNSHIYLPHFTEVNEWNTEISLVNTSGFSQPMDATFFSNQGTLSNTLTMEIPANGGINDPFSELFPEVDLQTGWIRFSTANYDLQGIMKFTYEPTEQTASLVIGRESGKTVLFPLLENNAVTRSGLAMINPNETGQTLNLVLIDLATQAVRNESVQIGANGKWLAMLDSLFTDLPAKYAMRIEGSQPLVGFGLTVKNDNKDIIAIPATYLPSPN